VITDVQEVLDEITDAGFVCIANSSVEAKAAITADRLRIVERLREMAVEVDTRASKATSAIDLQDTLYISPGLRRAADQLEREIKEAGT
jgi:hypothetical protein